MFYVAQIQWWWDLVANNLVYYLEGDIQALSISSQILLIRKTREGNQRSGESFQNLVETLVGIYMLYVTIYFTINK